MISQLDLSDARWEVFYPAHNRWYAAKVPGCVHTDLLRNNLIPDPFFGANEKSLQWIERENWAYRAAFEISPQSLSEEHLELIFDGLDTLATITVNGELIGRSDNMFRAYRFPVKGNLRPGTNRLEITFATTLDYLLTHEAWQPVKERNDPVGGRSRIRKEQCQYGWDWGPRFVTCGVWQPVRLETWSNARLDHVHLRQHHLADGSVSL